MGDYIGNRCLDIMSLFLHFKVKITVFTYTVVHPCTPIHLYTCTPIDLYTYTPVHSYALVHLYICIPKHLCTCTVELRIGGIFLPRNRPTLGPQVQSQSPELLD